MPIERSQMQKVTYEIYRCAKFIETETERRLRVVVARHYGKVVRNECFQKKDEIFWN